MHMPDVELHESTSLPQATALMERLSPDARFLAGGTDLLVDLKSGRLKVRHLVSLNRVEALHGICQDCDGLRIGALTTITELDQSEIVRNRFAPIVDATSQMAAPPIRNAATVGGNIASAVPCADLPPILMVMNASVVLWSSSGERTLPLEDFVTGVRRTALRNDEVLLAVRVPTPPRGSGAAYARFGLRNGNAIAVASVAAGLALGGDDIVQDVRIALGAVSPVPKLVERVQTALVGHVLDEAAFDTAARVAMEAAEPISDVRGSEDYRRELVQVLTRRALTTAHERAKKGMV